MEMINFKLEFDREFESFITKHSRSIGDWSKMTLSNYLYAPDRISRILIVGDIPFKQLELLIPSGEVREVVIPQVIEADFNIGEQNEQII